MKHRHSQRGLIHHLILPSLILMGIVLAGWSQIVNQNQVGVSIGRSVDATRAQLAQIQRALNWCRVMYPAGDNGTGLHPNLPASPADGSWMTLRDVVCPGEPDKTLWAATQEPLPMSGLYLQEWEYRNSAGGVYYRIRAEMHPGDGEPTVNPYGQAVLSQVAARLHPSLRTLSEDSLEILFVN